ncbi:MAG TPA: hypothetical protein VEE84_08355, partial [Burkholderiaceae bacterium]|nr:hypothetical protein [Burkholderiaceae bacterium]
LGGPDDAMRLVEVRRLLAGQAYFDLLEPRLGFDGYLTHWSRLVDLGLAGSIKLFSAFVDRDQAELLTREFWPFPFLAMMMFAQTAIAFSLGGQQAAKVAALLGSACLPGFAHFLPGAIDHHHVQAGLCAAAISLMVRGVSSPRAAGWAGILVATLLGIGLESLALVGVGASVMAVAFVRDGSRAPQVRCFALMLAAATAAIFVATVTPWRWRAVVCDSLAINIVVLVTLAGLGLAVATLVAHRGLLTRLAATSVAATIAVSGYLIIDPACALGPFAHVNPALWPLWLDHVTELQSIAALAGRAPGIAAFYAAFPLVGITAAIALLRRAQPPELLLIVAVFATACLIAALMVRAEVYANWFAVPLVATALADWLSRRPAWSLLRKATVVAAAAPLTCSTVALMVLNAGMESSQAETVRGDAMQSCFANAAYRSLARLPPGLVLSHMDIASHVLALTPHRVVMAPYHRLDRDILFALRLFVGPTDAAAAQLRNAHIDYVVDCPPLNLAAAHPKSFRTALVTDNAPDFLEPVAPGEGSPLLIWRVHQ